MSWAWELKEHYPGQFVYKMISVDIFGDKEENRLLGQRVYSVNVFEFRTKLHLRFIDDNDEYYVGDPISSIGWKDSGNIIQVTTTAGSRYTMQIAGGQGIRRTNTGLYEWDKKMG